MKKLLPYFVVLLALGLLWVLVESDSPKHVSLPPSLDMGSSDSGNIQVKEAPVDSCPKAVRMEADSILRVICKLEVEQFKSSHCYDTDLVHLGIVIPQGTLNRYSVQTVCGCGTGFVALAESRWAIFSMNDSKELWRDEPDPNFHW